MLKKDKPVYQRLADLRPKQKKSSKKKFVGMGVGSVAALIGATALKNRNHQ